MDWTKGADEHVSCSENADRPCKGSHRFRILNFEARVNGIPAVAVKSAEFKVGEHLWRLECHPAGVRPEVHEYVSLFVRYLGPEERVTAHWELRCVNQIDAGASKERRWAKNDAHNVFKRNNRWGWDKFMRKDQVLDRDRGFLALHAGHVIFEAGITLPSDNYTYTPAVARSSNPTSARLAVAQDLLQLLRSGDLSDAVFVCDGGERRLRAHRQILAARSQVFAAMFSGNYAEHRPSSEKGCTEVEIPDVDGSIMSELLHFLYAGELSVDLRRFAGDQVEGAAGNDDDEGGSGNEHRRKRRRSDADAMAQTQTQDALAAMAAHRRASAGRDASYVSASVARSDGAHSEALGAADGAPRSVDGLSASQLAERFAHLRFVLGLVQAADKYQVTELREACEGYLGSLIDKHSVVDLIALADTFNAHELKRLCLEFMERSRPVTLFRAQIPRLSKELLVEIMQKATAAVDDADALSEGARSLNHVFVASFMEFSSPDMEATAQRLEAPELRLRLRLFGIEADAHADEEELRERLLEAALGTTRTSAMSSSSMGNGSLGAGAAALSSSSSSGAAAVNAGVSGDMEHVDDDEDDDDEDHHERNSTSGRARREIRRARRQSAGQGKASSSSSSNKRSEGGAGSKRLSNGSLRASPVDDGPSDSM